MKTVIHLKTFKRHHVLIFKDLNGNLLDCEKFKRQDYTYLDMAIEADKFNQELKKAGVL